jgi:hypothetical protein
MIPIILIQNAWKHCDLVVLSYSADNPPRYVQAATAELICTAFVQLTTSMLTLIILINYTFGHSISLQHIKQSKILYVNHYGYCKCITM